MTELINMPHTNTIEDALTALNNLYVAADVSAPSAAEAMAVINDVLTRLVAKAEPELVLETEDDGYIIDGALQLGFDHVDDNANLMVIHCNDLVKYAHTQRTPRWISNEQYPLEPGPGLVVKAWNAGEGYPPQVWAGANPQGIKLLSCDWYIRVPDVPAAPCT